MKKEEAPTRFLLDEGAPQSVGHALLAAGFDVIWFADVLSSGAADDLVALTAIANQAVLVHVDKDMKRFAQKYGTHPADHRFSELSVLHVICDGVMAAKRVASAASLIEHELRFAMEKRARRFWVEIGNHHLKTNR